MGARRIAYMEHLGVLRHHLRVKDRVETKRYGEENIQMTPNRYMKSCSTH